MARFDAAWPKVLELEGQGEYVDHPADRGGPTRWGISQRAYPEEDIRHLTRERDQFRGGFLS